MTPARAVPGGVASWVLVAGLASALVLGCDGPAKREARELLGTVDQYRKADGQARSDRAQAVVAVACTDGEVCAAKQACLGAISPTVRALALKDEVSAGISAMEAQRAAGGDGSVPADAAGLATKLDEAEKLLKEGHANMEGCEKALAGLRVKYGG